MKRGRGTCGTFKVINLTYLHVLCAGMVYITLWYVHVPLLHVPVHSRSKMANFLFAVFLYNIGLLSVEYFFSFFIPKKWENIGVLIKDQKKTSLDLTII